MRRVLVSTAFCAASSLAAISAAQASGFDRGGVGIDLLFDPARVATEAGVVYVAPQRELKNVVRNQSVNPFNPVPRSSDSVDIGGDYAVPRLGAKFNLFEPVDCLATFTQPFGADSDYGENNAYSTTATKFSVNSDDYGLTCSYKFGLGSGQFRFIGGVSYGEVDASLSRQSLLDFGNEGVGVFELSDETWSWRAGFAYEVPDIAFRASVVYNARYDYDLEGTVDTRGFGATLGPGIPLPLQTGVFGVSASTEIPQALDVRVQTGIAAGTIVFASIRWQDWSQLQSIPISGVISPTTGQVNPNVSFDAFYEDGWTVSGGVGRKFSDRISGLVSLTWDKGTSVDQGFQSDSYSIGFGGAYTPTQNVELRLGGSVGVLTGGRSEFIGGDPANAVSYEYDADAFAAGSASLKVKF